jgi:thiamine pyrophosphate-dependent acetolactate synthase large subunit-like protein
VIAFGASLNYFTTDRGTLFRGKRLVQCDLDPGRIGSTVAIDAGVVGDAAKVAETITSWLAQADHKPSNFRSSDLADRLAAFDPAEAFDDRSVEGAIDPRTFTALLDRVLPTDRTLVVDAGRFMLNALTLSVPDPLSLITTHGFGSIGLGMSNAIGAGVARRDRPTVLAIGDGGFMMGGMLEFHTAVEHNIDLIVVLYNDGSYGAEHIQLYRKEMDTKASLHHWPDIPTVMASLGAKSVVVEKADDIDAVADAVDGRQPGRPVFIEAKLDPDVVSAITNH